ncbi:spore maturation protein, partial [Bacillus subtilis]|nr:spore maturation protein [Bacillus subtilis]
MSNGKMQDVNEDVFKRPKEPNKISFVLMSVLVFWLGLMKIAEQSGLLDIFSRMCRHFISKLLPYIQQDHPAMG